MKLRLVLLPILIAFVAMFAVAKGIDGKWKASTQGPNGTMDITFDLKADDAGKITGTVTGPMGEMQVTDGKLDGEDISFTVAHDDFKVVHKGKVSGDSMKLKVEMGDNSFDMEAKRVTP